MRSTPPSALLISPSQQDHDFLHALFSEEGWTLHSAPSLASATAILRRSFVAALITEANLPVGTWKDVLSVLDPFANRPMVIVTSLHADDRLWAEALNLGAYDVLAKPFNKTELVRVLNSVWNRNIVSKLAAARR